MLAGELANAQHRANARIAAFARDARVHQDAMRRLRGELAASESRQAATRDELDRLRAALPELSDRERLLRERERERVRIDSLRSSLMQAREALVLERRSRERAGPCSAPAADDASPTDASADPGSSDDAVGRAGAALADRAVLCVGGKPALVPAYRRMIEQAGARFIHHDGGDEESVARLDRTLAAADLVICQAACISHDAYWRLKDHCKRTGKPCVFVDSPSRAGLARAFGAVRIGTVRIGTVRIGDVVAS